MNIKSEIINWFLNNSDTTESEISNNLDENFLLSGWIDSLKFVSFIIFLEEKFEIKFDNDEFQNRKFSTINGINEIILGKLNGQV